MYNRKGYVYDESSSLAEHGFVPLQNQILKWCNECASKNACAKNASMHVSRYLHVCIG